MILSRRLTVSLALAATVAPLAGWAQDAPIVIGYQLPLTGNTAQYGQDFKSAAEIALEKFNASGALPVPVEIIYEDSRSDAKEGVTIARKFVDNDDIVAVLGDFTSTVSMAAAQVYKKAGVVQLSQTASHPDFAKISEWQFRNITTQDQEGAVNAEWMHEKGIEKVAVIAEQTDWGQSVVKGFTTPFKDMGGEVVFEEFFNRGLADFRSIITKIDETNPDAVYTGFFYEDGAQFLKQMEQLGVDIPVYSTSAAYNDKLIELSGEAADGLFLTATFLPTREDAGVQEFVEEWKSLHDGAAPGQFPAQAYDAVNIMLEAVVRAYPDVTRESMREAVAATTDFPGVTGNTSFDENGEPLKELTKATVENGEFVEVK
ncbi:ABC transporter substrate-binding protein [Tropicimonas isoalkanivorans]|uniref:Branched-chain amino acid transport system substrate-binding protein n=1 Tax=Tropicimonas isoalkanivorans TaxID=441112 RepID=A0A1I1HEN0_9RHOB|nr:ABC transporter substrate-binding protein [Tropicimonas isoalkanivorans]SFC22424.1 branched-chain amino acid transport system substrate-binding protein [Tropicimonas isoalkanivorans]